MRNRRDHRQSDGLWRLGAAVALAFLLLQAWMMWNEGRQTRDPYREPRGGAVKVQSSTEFSFPSVWERLQEFYRVGE